MKSLNSMPAYHSFQVKDSETNSSDQVISTTEGYRFMHAHKIRFQNLNWKILNQIAGICMYFKDTVLPEQARFWPYWAQDTPSLAQYTEYQAQNFIIGLNSLLQ